MTRSNDDAADSTVQPVLLEAVVAVMATYRLMVLVKDDKITEPLRDAVFRRYGHLEEDDAPTPSYLMGCPWCLSIYFGALAVAARRFAPRWWRPVSRVLALSAATGLLAEAVAGAQRLGSTNVTGGEAQ